MNVALALSALAMGFLGSTHCVVMCGGVVGILSGGLVPLGKQAPTRPALQVALSAGRVAMYSAFGAGLGELGSVVESVQSLRNVQLLLRLAAGVLMIGTGLYLSGVWRKYERIERLGAPLWRRIKPLARRLVPVRSWPAAFALGALWGFMPCGLVYGALGLAIATGSASDGATTMALFGIGTMPAMLFLGAFARWLAELGSTRWVRRAAGSAIILFGLLNVAVAILPSSMHIPGTPVCCTTNTR